MSVTVRVVRRFNCKTGGVSTVARFFKDLELPAVPARDQLLNAEDGTPEMIAWTIRQRARGPSPSALPTPRVEVATKTEDAAGIEALPAAGWVALEAEPPEPGAST